MRLGFLVMVLMWCMMMVMVNELIADVRAKLWQRGTSQICHGKVLE